MRTLRLMIRRLGQHRYLRQPIRTLWNTYEHLVFVTSTWRNLRQADYVAEIDPYRVFNIPPSSTTTASGGSFDFLRDTGLVSVGNWDIEHGSSIKERGFYRAFLQRYIDDVPWDQTELLTRKAKKIARNREDRFPSVDAYRVKLTEYDRMFEAFSEGYYLTQSKLVNRNHSSHPGDGGRAIFPSLTDHSLIRHEIAVNIGRNGQFLFLDGRHRLGLALIAGLDEVPVRAVVRHEQWQTLRDDIAIAIDNELADGTPPTGIPELIAESFENRLKSVPCGLDHPDLSIIIERRLTTD